MLWAELVAPVGKSTRTPKPVLGDVLRAALATIKEPVAGGGSGALAPLRRLEREAPDGRRAHRPHAGLSGSSGSVAAEPPGFGRGPARLCAPRVDLPIRERFAMLHLGVSFEVVDLGA